MEAARALLKLDKMSENDFTEDYEIRAKAYLDANGQLSPSGQKTLAEQIIDKIQASTIRDGSNNPVQTSTGGALKRLPPEEQYIGASLRHDFTIAADGKSLPVIANTPELAANEANFKIPVNGLG